VLTQHASYDLGEFDQKGTVATKWGTKAEMVKLAQTAKANGVGIYWDAVLNHKFGGDRKETCKAEEVDENDRTKSVSDCYEIEAWVGFHFSGRKGRYSPMKWHWYHFSGVDFDARTGKKAIFKIMGDRSTGWAEEGDVDSEKGNYDYLMGSDIDYAHPEAEQDVLNWGKWLARELPLMGIRFDAIKHYSEEFLLKFVTQMDEHYGKGWFFVGEFWKDSLDDMTAYLGRMHKKFSLFDAPLVYRFSSISRTPDADLRQVFDGTLVQAMPVNAVVSHPRCSSFQPPSYPERPSDGQPRRSS